MTSGTPASVYNIFTHHAWRCRGNPAGVIFSESEPPAPLMQSLAAQHQLPAISFLWPAAKNGHYHVRWYAPDMEIQLCGHGAMAAFAWLHEEKQQEKATLHYPFGKISGGNEAPQMVYMTTAAIPVTEPLPVADLLKKGLGLNIAEHYATANKNIVVTPGEKELREMKPDFGLLRKLPYFGYSVTALSSQVDFVSRTIIPKTSQLEDYATGSSHAALAPYWQPILKKDKLQALQLSSRGGYFECELPKKDTVLLKGNYTRSD